MSDQQDQAKPVESGVSITLWLPPSAIEDLNELVSWKTTRVEIASRSSVVTELIRREHKREKGKR